MKNTDAKNGVWKTIGECKDPGELRLSRKHTHIETEACDMRVWKNTHPHKVQVPNIREGERIQVLQIQYTHTPHSRIESTFQVDFNIFFELTTKFLSRGSVLLLQKVLLFILGAGKSLKYSQIWTN